MTYGQCAAPVRFLLGCPAKTLHVYIATQDSVDYAFRTGSLLLPYRLLARLPLLGLLRRDGDARGIINVAAPGSDMADAAVGEVAEVGWAKAVVGNTDIDRTLPRAVKRVTATAEQIAVDQYVASLFASVIVDVDS